MLEIYFSKKNENKKVKSILDFEKWTKINVQNRKVKKSFENQCFFSKFLYILF